MYRTCAMTAMLPAMGAFLIGLFLGWLLTTNYAVAAISRSQERMQRKVRYWQAETASARMESERLVRLLQAHDIRPKPAPWEEY